MNALARPQAAVQARVGRVGGRSRPSLAGKRVGAFGNARPSTRKAGLERAQARADRSVVAMVGSPRAKGVRSCHEGRKGREGKTEASNVDPC